MDDVNKLEAVTERDIDLLLLEEFNVSAEFCRWFIGEASGSEQDSRCRGAWHSVTDAALGESDLLAIYEMDEGSCAVLIENKIDAVAQPEQADRYHARGRLGVESGGWDKAVKKVVFVLCDPEGNGPGFLEIEEG